MVRTRAARGHFSEPVTMLLLCVNVPWAVFRAHLHERVVRAPIFSTPQLGRLCLDGAFRITGS